IRTSGDGLQPSLRGVGDRGFEPRWAQAHTDLNRARLPSSASRPRPIGSLAGRGSAVYQRPPAALPRMTAGLLESNRAPMDRYNDGVGPGRGPGAIPAR